MIQAFILKVISYLIQKSTNDMALDLLLITARMILVHLFSGIDIKFWLLEISYLFIGVLMDKSEFQSQNLGKLSSGPFLVLYLSGIFFIILNYFKDHKIALLEKTVRMKVQLIR